MSSPWTSAAFALGDTFASLQISSATCGLTREKSSIEDVPSRSCPASPAASLRSMPSSTPCGCGLISCGSRGSSLVDAREDAAARPSAGVYVEPEVRVRDDGLLEVLLHAGAPAAVRRDELHLDARAVVALPLDGVVLDDVGLVALACRCAARSGTRGDPCRSSTMMMTGLPVVSCAYRPAALMPMPCWPRDWRRRWNLEP